MKSKLYIPKKIKVGYQKREGTYTNKLAYVIYWDDKGVLRKESSWQSWRHKDQGEDEFENKPYSGFVINKDVKRSSEWFGNGRNMVRVYDERGIEFEITTGNLMFVLMTTDCLKRGLQGDFVYAWYGTELVLLPVGCDEYKSSTVFTDLQAGKIGVKNLVPGCSYKTKQMQDLIYVGKYDWHRWGYKRDRANRSYSYGSETFKSFIFMDDQGKFLPLKGLTSLAAQNTDIPVDNFAEIMEKFAKSPHATKIKGLTSRKLPYVVESTNAHVWHNQYNRKQGFILRVGDDTFEDHYIHQENKYDHKTSQYIPTEKYEFEANQVISFKDGELKQEYKNRNYGNNWYGGRREPTRYSKSHIEEQEFVELIVTMESGAEYEYHDYMSVQRGY